MIKERFRIQSADMHRVSAHLRAVTNQKIYKIALIFFGSDGKVISDNFALDKEYEVTIKEVDTNE